MDNKILDKIKKLIRKQESAEKIGSIKEAELFAAKIQELLAKHNLQFSDVSVEETIEEIDRALMKSQLPTIGGKSAYDIMFPIAKYNWCHIYLLGNQSTNKMTLIGKKENIEVCIFIFNIVSRIFISESKRAYKTYLANEDYIWKDSRLKPVGYDTYARTFMSGASNGLYEKLRAERQRFEKDNDQAHGLVVVNDSAIKHFVKNKMGGSKKGRKVKVGNYGDAFSKGKQTGKNVKISKGLSGKAKPIDRKLLG